MKPYYESGGITLYCGDCREILPKHRIAVVSGDDLMPNLDGLLAAGHALAIESVEPEFAFATDGLAFDTTQIPQFLQKTGNSWTFRYWTIDTRIAPSTAVATV